MNCVECRSLIERHTWEDSDSARHRKLRACERHVRRCASCREYFAALERAGTPLVQRAADFSVPPELENFTRTLPTTSPEHHRPDDRIPTTGILQWRWIGLATAACAALAVLVALPRRTPFPSPAFMDELLPAEGDVSDTPVPSAHRENRTPSVSPWSVRVRLSGMQRSFILRGGETVARTVPFREQYRGELSQSDSMHDVTPIVIESPEQISPQQALLARIPLHAFEGIDWSREFAVFIFEGPTDTRFRVERVLRRANELEISGTKQTNPENAARRSHKTRYVVIAVQHI